MLTLEKLEILTRYCDLVLTIWTAVMSLAFLLFARARTSERRRRQLRLIRVIASILLIAAAINLRNMLRFGLGPFPELDINYDGAVITDADVVRSPHNLGMSQHLPAIKAREGSSGSREKQVFSFTTSKALITTT